MERLMKFACYCRRTRSDNDNAPTSSPHADEPAAAVGPSSSSAISAQNTSTEASRGWRYQDTVFDDAAQLLWNFLERILPGDNFIKSLQVLLLGTLIVLIILSLYLRGLSVGSTIIILPTSYYVLMIPDFRENLEAEVLYSRFEQIKEIAKKMLYQMGQLRNKQPGLFCIIACSASVLVWLLDYVLNGMLLKYIFFMFVLLAPIAVIYLPIRRLPARPPPSNRRESDSEIEEFLPAATETNIQILTKAGDVGEYSPTPTNVLTEAPKEHEEQEFLNDGDLAGHKMPSHEDGSSDGLELSDLELSEKSSTSSCSGQSDSEFEIIDRQEIGKLCTPQNST